MPSDRRGMAAAELAMIGGILVLMVLGIFDLGLWIWQRMEMQAALTAGAHYAQEFPSDTNGITAAITAALPSSMANASTGTTNATITVNCGCDPTDANEKGLVCCPGPQGVLMNLTISYPYSPLYLTAITTNVLQYTIRIQ